MHFIKLGLIEPLARAVRSEGYTQPTPIQQQAIPHVLAGRDILGCAQTGTGKTAAFALPILQRLAARPAALVAPPKRLNGGVRLPRGQQPQPIRPIRALIVAPTRELASQIGESFASYGRHTGLVHTVIFGGVSQGPQATALRNGVDILVATPGRLLDLLSQKLVTLEHVEILVLDEADRMLDMGFIHDIRKLIALIPARRQTLLYSATMPGEIRQLANSVLTDPVEVRVAAQSAAADTVDQSLYFAERGVKNELLEQLLGDPAVTRALVFTRTKHGADKVVRCLHRAGIAAEAIHSNKSQNARIRALDNFKRGKILALVASDIAARGLDVDDISHVINYDMPADPETYVHRIGRTGRAGATGRAITFCTDEQRGAWKAIARLVNRPIPVLTHDLVAPPTQASPVGAPPRQSKPRPQAKQGGRARHGSGDASASHGGRAKSHGQSKGQSKSHGQSKGQPKSHGQSQGGSQGASPQGERSHRAAGAGSAGGSNRPSGPGGRSRRRRRSRW